jgi:hypothetical protein
MKKNNKIQKETMVDNKNNEPLKNIYQNENIKYYLKWFVLLFNFLILICYGKGLYYINIYLIGFLILFIFTFLLYLVLTAIFFPTSETLKLNVVVISIVILYLCVILLMNSKDIIKLVEKLDYHKSKENEPFPLDKLKNYIQSKSYLFENTNFIDKHQKLSMNVLKGYFSKDYKIIIELFYDFLRVKRYLTIR